MTTEKITVFLLDMKRPCWYMRYLDPITGRHVTRTTGVKMSRRKDAEKVAAKWESELEEGRYVRPSKVSWDEFRARYEDEQVRGLAPTTAGKVSAIFNQVEQYLNPSKPADLTAERLSHLVKCLREHERRNPGESRKPSKKKKGSKPAMVAQVVGLSETTIKHSLAHLMAALRWAKKMGMLAKLPEVEKPQRAKKSTATTPHKGRAITSEEFERLLAAVPKVVGDDVQEPDTRKPEQVEQEARRIESWKHLLRGLWWSGLRLGEAMELWWDRDDKLSVDMTGGRPMLRIRAELEKANEDRMLPIATEFANFLLAIPEDERTGPVFNPLPRRVKGDRLTTHAVGELIVLMGVRAAVKVQTDMRTGKVKFASAHDLRRSFGDRWASRVMPAVLKQMMRHADIETTLRFYATANAKKTTEVIDQAFAKAKSGLNGNTLGNSDQDATAINEQPATQR